jgi:hypothetical protein
MMAGQIVDPRMWALWSSSSKSFLLRLRAWDWLWRWYAKSICLRGRGKVRDVCVLMLDVVQVKGDSCLTASSGTQDGPELWGYDRILNIYGQVFGERQVTSAGALRETGGWYSSG